MSAANGRQAPATPAAAPGPSRTSPPLDDEMLENSDSEEEDNHQNETVRDFKRQLRAQAKQTASLMELVTQLTAQIMATPNERPKPPPKMATPEKYDGGRTELRTFLTTIELYCEFHGPADDQGKILMASMHMKGKAASWMQPFVDDYLKNPLTGGTKKETQTLFTSWTNFKEEMGRIFGEVDDQNQAERAITRLKQTKSVSSYTAEFKQLQSRIDWDDAALRTVYEIGLKETIKDGLVHHDKPEDLQALVELATRIDNRLQERNQQRTRDSYVPANTKRFRKTIRVDREGDVIMTDQVQAKDRKPKGKFRDGLSKEERQRRYDNKACLRCGKEGHFRRDCPENDKGRQGAVKIGMIRQGTPYPREQSTDSDVSDMELYEEARLLDNATYELLPRAVEAKEVIGYDEVTSTDWQVNASTIRQRLRDQQCWACGFSTHQADQCYRRNGRIAITGPGAEEAIEQAFKEQPYFEESDNEEVSSLQDKEPQEAHEKNRAWEDATKDRKSKEDEWYTEDAASGQGAIPHSCLHWTFCYQDSCRIHYDAKYGAGYFPRKRKGKQSKN